MGNLLYSTLKQQCTTLSCSKPHVLSVSRSPRPFRDRCRHLSQVPICDRFDLSTIRLNANVTAGPMISQDAAQLPLTFGANIIAFGAASLHLEHLPGPIACPRLAALRRTWSRVEGSRGSGAARSGRASGIGAPSLAPAVATALTASAWGEHPSFKVPASCAHALTRSRLGGVRPNARSTSAHGRPQNSWLFSGTLLSRCTECGIGCIRAT